MGQEPRVIVWSASALEDLVDVLENVAVYSPGTEDQLYEDLMAAAASLSTLSERGRLVPELHDQRTREIFVRDYRLMHEPHGDCVIIIAVVFGRRDFATWWRERRDR